MTTWKIGTVGFGYKQWLGTFYPEKMPSRQFLPHFAQFFDSAEIDSTFYGTPRATSVNKWTANTPPTFTFCPKTPRAITHDTPIAAAAPAMLEFIASLRQMGPRLGAILVQYPAAVHAHQLTDLDAFLSHLPTTTRYAIEFRHPSWESAEVDAVLRSHNVSRVAADYGTSNEHKMRPFYVSPTADFLYMRFIGWHGAFNTKNEVKLDQTTRLQRWLTQLQPHLPNLKTIYAYFNNDYSGYSIATANQLKSMLNLPHSHPKLLVQQSLF